LLSRVKEMRNTDAVRVQDVGGQISTYKGGNDRRLTKLHNEELHSF
jgi:hypothetical protein